VSPETGVWEIYSAIQGEGLLVGERHVFLRLARCNLDCRFCDTPARGEPPETCAVEQTPGTGDFEALPNPVDSRRAAIAVARLAGEQPSARRVSFTGGEPLVSPEFVRSVAEALRAERIGTVLETNGTLADALQSLGDLFGWISMDVKLPSSAGGDAHWEEHEAFLRIAAGGKVFVKVVVTPETNRKDMVRASRMIAAVDGRIPLVLQPVTPSRDVGNTAPRDLLRALETTAKEDLENVRIIPQVHRVLGER